MSGHRKVTVRIRRTSIKATCAALMLMHALTSIAYEISTHQVLSSAAVNKSVLAGSDLLPRLGLSAYGSNQLPNAEDAGLVEQSVQSLIRFGSAYEDTDGPPVRPFNHFFDPQFNDGQGRGLDTFLAKGQPSPDWALEDRGHLVSLASPPFSTRLVSQEYSLRHGYENLHLGLTAQTKAERDNAFGRMFQIIGQVIHHIQDMGQPEHTRNDAHLSDTPESFFERYTRSGRYPGGADDEMTLLPRDLMYWGDYPVPVAGDARLPTARSFWYTPDGGVPRYKGMAEYSSNNFVTRDSNLLPDFDGGLLSAAPGFPLPDGMSAYIGPRESVTIRYADGSTVSKRMTLVKGAVWDGYLNNITPDVPLASLSVFHRWLSDVLPSGESLLTINRFVYEQQYPLLLPRAVAFSAGLINHFFRGDISIERDAGNPSAWNVMNEGKLTTSGLFSVLYEAQDGRRYPVAGTHNWYRTLEPGAGFQVVLQEPSASTRKMIIAFEGDIGSEFGTTGRVSDYAPPPVPCGGKISARGGIEGYDAFMQLGTTAGKMQFGFEAFNIPDKLTVTLKDSDKKLTGSKGYVSGFRIYEFDFDSGSLGTSEVRVRVEGSEAGTKWEVDAGCPGEEIDDPRINVAFRFYSPDRFSIKDCRGHFYIDEQYHGTLSSGTRTIKLTPGQHSFEYRNKECDASTLNSSNNYSAEYTDSTGTYPLGSGRVTGANTGLFIVSE